MVADEGGGGRGGSEVRRAIVVAKEPGVFCGKLVVERLLSNHYPSCSTEWQIEPGERFNEGSTILRISGECGEILRSERIILNILGRLSGISTNTSNWVSSIGGIGIACTRKVDWGLLDKWAVHIGGGLTHRLSRADALMIKDSEVLAGARPEEIELDSLRRLVSEIDMERDVAFTVVEVRTVEQAVVTASIWDSRQRERGGRERVVLLLDNMGPEKAKEATIALESRGLRSCCVLEGSGGVSLDSLREWSNSGVDLVSSSLLNRGVPPLDMSMKFEGGS
tara:strand:+ start:18420 stop:19259 length:840 start_codon:yes stop_codon:yes gene_type:complete